ncbi:MULTISPECIES: site-specific integrase [unclassified Vibrio]|uniref:site-specific integrase n=1 Tax=unclassified Vibrio TaxID=2614977 RepID=UPI0027C2706E|nr:MULTISPECIES: site-specific integrase [unclassified Vibrio]MDQ2107641.1 tyrosine-type recombinase/integrase [Vibrio sp. 2017_1457_15]MDQ2160453.1 tyrosine-type recombinase/integrase [Vibrio sp. 2017_1457_13]
MAQNAIVDNLPSGIEVRGNSLRISFYYNGKRHRESLGLPPTKQNINFARQKREAIQYEIKIGTFNYAFHFPNSKHASGKPKALDIKHLSELFLASKEHDIRTSTYNRYKWVLKDFAETYGANRSCDTLSPRSLTQFRQKLVKGRSSRTVNNNLVTINAFLSWLHKMEYVSRDLSDALKRVKQGESDIQPFSMEEITKALSVCRQLQHRNMITLLVYSGIRSGELCALAWEDVDFENKTIQIRRSTYDHRGLKTTKTDKERFVDLLPPAVEALKAQRHLTYLYPAKEHSVELPGKTFRTEKLRFVFNPKAVREQKNSDYDYYGKRALGRVWTELCKKADIPHRNQYQLRHTYASWMITHANVNISYLAQQMGHADITMVAKVYGKWLKESNKKESDRVWLELLKLKNSI